MKKIGFRGSGQGNLHRTWDMANIHQRMVAVRQLEVSSGKKFPGAILGKGIGIIRLPETRPMGRRLFF